MPLTLKKVIAFIFVILILIFFASKPIHNYLLQNLSKNEYIDKLNLAVQSNNINKVKDYLSVKRNINVISDSKLCKSDTYIEVSCISPLETACIESNYEMVKLLIENGADVNYANPLFKTAGNDNLAEQNKIIKLLLDEGADPNVITAPYNPIISQLVSSPIFKIKKNETNEKYIYNSFKLLVESGAKIEFDKDIEPILITATKSGNTRIVDYLLNELKVDRNVSDKEGKTALDYAKESNNEKLIELLN